MSERMREMRGLETGPTIDLLTEVKGTIVVQEFIREERYKVLTKPKEHNRILRDLARTAVSLGRLIEVSPQDESLTKDEKGYLTHYAKYAETLLKERNYYGMEMLLEPTAVFNPNGSTLEQFVRAAEERRMPSK